MTLDREGADDEAVAGDVTGPGRFRAARTEDRVSIVEVAEASGLFPLEELAEVVATFDAFVTGATDADRWVVDDAGSELAAVAYYAPERMTDGTWNLYWLAVHPRHQREGRGAGLVRHVEQQLRVSRPRVLEAELAALRQELATATENAAHKAQRHSEELDAFRADHVQHFREAQRQAEATIAEVREEARTTVEDTNAARERAEGTAAELRVELDAAKHAADEAVATIRSEASAARLELAEQLASRHEAESRAAQAKAEVEIARAQAQADSAREIAENQASEVERLVAQVEDLRADLRRSRREP